MVMQCIIQRCCMFYSEMKITKFGYYVIYVCSCFVSTKSLSIRAHDMFDVCAKIYTHTCSNIVFMARKNQFMSMSHVLIFI